MNNFRIRLASILALATVAGAASATTTSTAFDPATAGTAFAAGMGPLLTTVVPVLIGIILITAAPKIIMKHLKKGTKV